VGLLTALVTLPLAPVRGTVWLAEQLAAEAARQLDDESSIRSRLVRAEIAYELGELTRDEFEAVEDELLEQLDAIGADVPLGAR
jgi:hypothetical protein